jgi:RimJ/RimL family protein N-acetyltransferase
MKLKLESQRLTLRPFEEKDAQRIAFLAGDYAVAKMCARVPHPYTMAHAHDFVGFTLRGRESGGDFVFAVTRPIDGVVGACGVSRVKDAKRTFEIGYWFGMPYWGLGYASEAARLVMDWAREQLDAQTFQAGHFTDNPASGNVLRKLGFAPTGERNMFGLARQCASPAQRYVWPEGAAEVTLQDHHHPH